MGGDMEHGAGKDGWDRRLADLVQQTVTKLNGRKPGI